LMQATREDSVGERAMRWKVTDEPCNSVKKIYDHPPIRVLCGSHFRSYNS
jgi:hypothetical protein